MESDQKRVALRPAAVILVLALIVTLLLSALPTMDAAAVTCKFKHTVVAGDTITYIGQLYQVDWQEIAKANNISAPYTLAVGQILCIPSGTEPPNTTGGKKDGKVPTLDVVPSLGHIFVAVENFAPKTPYYVRLYANRVNLSYRIGNFTTNKEGDWSGWFKVPGFMPRFDEMQVCVKNTWTDAVSCDKYQDPSAQLLYVIGKTCAKEGR